MTEFIVFVRRYDLPVVSIGVHRFTLDTVNPAGFEALVAPQLMSEDAAWEVYSDAYVAEETKTTISGFGHLGGDKQWLVDPLLFRMVKRACPIEFHQGLHEGQPNVLNRVQVLRLEPWVPGNMCLEDAQMDGGYTGCGTELVDGECPLEPLHRLTWNAHPLGQFHHAWADEEGYKPWDRYLAGIVQRTSGLVDEQRAAELQRRARALAVKASNAGGLPVS